MDNFQDLLLATNALAVPFSYLFNSVFVTLTRRPAPSAVLLHGAYPLSKARGLPRTNIIFELVIAT